MDIISVAVEHKKNVWLEYKELKYLAKITTLDDSEKWFEADVYDQDGDLVEDILAEEILDQLFEMLKN
jgi:hypothetical protein